MEDLISVFRWNIHITDAVRDANEFKGCGNDAEYTFIQSRFVNLSGRGSLKDNVVDNDDDDGDSDNRWWMADEFRWQDDDGRWRGLCAFDPQERDIRGL